MRVGRADGRVGHDVCVARVDGRVVFVALIAVLSDVCDVCTGRSLTEW